MTTAVDAIYATDSAGNLSMYELSTGSNMMSFKTENNAISPKSLSVLRNHIVASGKGPIIRTWRNTGVEKLPIRMIAPGSIGCCTVSPDELYIAVSTGLKMLVWQLSTGKLLSTVTSHYQPISVIRWSRDGSFIISGGEDGLVCVWKFSEIITSNQICVGALLKTADMMTRVAPCFTFSHHSVAVTDIYVGFGALLSRLFTTSKDNTLKVYDLASGSLLLSTVFDAKPMAVLVDAREMFVFVGMFDGKIYEISLLEPPRNLDYHFKPTDTSAVLTGHTKSITCLALSTDDTTLVSGSADETINLWHVPSKQLLRTIRMKGIVQNVVVRLLLDEHERSDASPPTTVIVNFEKLYDVRDSLDTLEVSSTVDKFQRDEKTKNKVDDETEEKREMKKQMEELRNANDQLYLFCQKLIEKRADNASVGTKKLKLKRGQK